METSQNQQNELAELLRENNEQLKKIAWEAYTNRRTQDVIRTAVAAPILNEVQDLADNKQLSFLATIEAIRDEGLSFARFGDGEMKLMLRPDYKLGFQKNSPELATALRNVLVEPRSDKTLIGFPHVYRDLHWTGVWCDIWGQMSKLVQGHSRFGNSHVSRPVFFQNTGEAGVQAWRSVWEGKNVIVITGQDSRFEVVPALFDGTASFNYLFSSATNAFEDIDRVRLLALSTQADIFLISLGPAGTVLANDLAKEGRQAIDIGHISDSYQTVFEGGAWPESKPATTKKA